MATLASPEAPPLYDVAFSFAGEDRPYVTETASWLRERGIRVFYDADEQVDLWGKNLQSHLGDIFYKHARFSVLFVSQHYAQKVWTNHELRSALARALNEPREYVLPARFDDTELPGLLSSIGCIDLRRTRPTELAERIQTKVCADLSRRLTALSRLASEQLKTSALSLAKEMRDILGAYHDSASARAAILGQGTTDQERQHAWNDDVTASLAATRALMAQYENQCKARAILLRDELQFRCFDRNQSKDFMDRIYEQPPTPIGLGQIVDDLERLALRLP